jgi:hypothetical protein
MNTNDVIEAYVVDVMRRLPGKDRNEIGFELRDQLTQMLAERAQTAGKAADDAMVLAMLREFGAPADVAERYMQPGMVIIPAGQTRSFALLSLIGIVVQWALTLPRVFAGEQSVTVWWLTWGLGSLWWPGFMAMTALVAAWLRRAGWFRNDWKPSTVDPERVNRGLLAFGLFWFAIGVALTAGLPWIVDRLRDPLPQVFAFDPEFLRVRAWPVLVLWAGTFATLVAVLVRGRYSPLMRKVEMVFSLAFVALMVWWLAAGDIFQAKMTNDGARAGLGLVILILLIDWAVKLYRRVPRIRTPTMAGR